MYKEVLRAIANVEIFPVIALGVFFVFFIVMLIRVMRIGKQEENEIASIPFKDGTAGIDKSIDNPLQPR